MQSGGEARVSSQHLHDDTAAATPPPLGCQTACVQAASRLMCSDFERSRDLREHDLLEKLTHTYSSIRWMTHP